jgi:hypothetical protein
MAVSVQARSRLGPGRPFPGLRAYGFADHRYFFGREDQIFTLYRLLDRSRFAAVVGTSGSGKSSLVRAGLLPLLAEETLEGRARRWSWFELRPGNQPIARLAEVLANSSAAGEQPDPGLREARRETVEALLRRSSFGLREAVQEIHALEGHAILIVVDQFEEIFRYAEAVDGEQRDRLLSDARRNEAAAFVQLLLEGSRDRDRPIHVMLTMRSDYLGECARFYELPEAVAANQFLVPSLTRDQCEEAIVGPIRHIGAAIEPALVQRLLNDGTAGNDHLPALQHALMRIWDEAGRTSPPGERCLMTRHYDAIGTLSKALSQHADEIMSALAGLEQGVEQVFRALAELDRDNRAIRRPLRLDQLRAETGLPDTDLRHILDRFRQDDCSFLLPAHPQMITDDTIVDIGHEALIRRWDRMQGNHAPGGREQQGWLWSEADDGNVYRGLLALGSSASSELAKTRLGWWTSRPRTAAWADRYGGQLGKVEQLFKDSQKALIAEGKQKEKEEADRRKRMQRAVAAAVGCGLLAAVATVGFVEARHQKGVALKAAARADAAVIETKASSYWSRLQLFGDSLKPDGIETLWELTLDDEAVRVEFVRQLAEHPELLRRFGSRPQPIVRAIGLRWPEEAREIARKSLAHVASDTFDPSEAERFELITYTRALAALEPWLDPALAEAARRKIADAINGMADQDQLHDRELWTLAETVATFSEHLDPAPIATARDRLRRQIAEPPTSDSGDRSARALARIVELMAPELDPTERGQAVEALAPLLGKHTDSWWANATPRALLALAPALDRAQAAPLLETLPPAIAAAAADKADGDGAYLLALMQLAEELADHVEDEVVVAWGKALLERFKQPNDPLQHAALARATVPLLRKLGMLPDVLVPTIAGITMVRPPRGALLSHSAVKNLENAQAALLRALHPAAGQESAAAADAIGMLGREWRAPRAEDSNLERYRRSAQIRLVALLAPTLSSDAAAAVAAELRALLRATNGDYLTREAIARAIEAVAGRLSPADRAKTLADTQRALAATGSTEEAGALARSIAALLPADDPQAATAEIVEALKYPTATGEPTDILLAGLETLWPSDYHSIANLTLPNRDVLDWLEAHLPDEVRLRDVPPRPPDLGSGGELGAEPG